MTEARRLVAEAAAALADAGVASPEYDAATLLAHVLGTSRGTVAARCPTCRPTGRRRSATWSGAAPRGSRSST